MRLLFFCFVVAMGLLATSSVRAQLEDLEKWEGLDHERFGQLAEIAWFCGNLHELYHSFDLEFLAGDYLRPTLDQAARFGAGKAQLLLLERAYWLGVTNAADGLQATEWYGNPESDEYQKTMVDLVEKSPDSIELCVIYSDLE